MFRLPASPADFDHIARPYRWLEYLTFGRALERCRERLLSHMLGAREALVLGDGDGRFLAQLLDQNRYVRAIAIDSSRLMLQLLAHRCARNGDRLAFRCDDARDAVLGLPMSQQFDLVVTHFFLDCFDQPQLEGLVATISARILPRALWVVSEFHVPVGWRGILARVIVRSLYGIFGVLTHLPVSRLPDHAGALTRAGFHCIDRQHRLAGLLVSELWQRQS